VIVDAQSVKTTDLTKNSGYDGGKKISGIKRHMAVDINGLPQAILVTRANVYRKQRVGGAAMGSVVRLVLAEWFSPLRPRPSFETARRACALARSRAHHSSFAVATPNRRGANSEWTSKR
jgi:hypothetical protein